MKLTDGIKLKGRPVEIPDCSRDDLPGFFKELGFKTGVEIGSYKGEYAAEFAKLGLQICAIDPWKAYEDFDRPDRQARLDFQYDHTKRVLEHYPNATVLRKTSMEALADFPDESLDFVYIDGNHLFKYIAEDVCEWSKKVRKGGIISGHDYIYDEPVPPRTESHVYYVIDAYVKSHGIENFWVLGKKEYVEGEKRDKWRSWMFFKGMK